MEASEVRGIVQAELTSFREDSAQSTIGSPWSIARVKSDVASLRNALIEPRLATVRIGKTGQGSNSKLETREFWVITRPVENGYLIVFDPESREFGLAVTGAGGPETVSVWGDLIGTFCAR